MLLAPGGFLVPLQLLSVEQEEEEEMMVNTVDSLSMESESSSVQYPPNERRGIQGHKEDVFAPDLAAVPLPQCSPLPCCCVPPPLASFVWRLHKHPLYLAHLPPSLSLSLSVLHVFEFSLSHFPVLLSSRLPLASHSSPSADLHFLRFCLPSSLSSSFTLITQTYFFFQSHLFASLSSSSPCKSLSVSSFCTSHSYLHGSSLLPSLHCHVSSPLCCAAGQFAVCQILMTCPLEFKVSLWLSCVTSTYSSHPFALWSSSRCFTEKGFPHVF